MAEFGKRSEVTVETMGKVNNPTGSGIAPFKQTKQQHHQPPPPAHHGKRSEESHATTKIEEGSSRRNITRKKTDASLSGKYDSRTKKHGGAGKGKWLNGSSDHGGIDRAGTSASAAASNLLAEEDVLDVNDPLYIPEIDSDPNSYILSSSNTSDAARLAGAKPDAFDTNHQRPIYGPLLTLSEFKLRLDDILREYFDSSDAHEVIRSISELGCTLYHPHILVRAIGLGMDAGPRERELISRLLSCLHPTPLSDAEMEAGYEMVLDRVEDWMIDIPDATAMLGSFLARAVIDEVLPPAFLSNRNNTHPGDEVVAKAVSLLSREHCSARLEKVWGPGDGRPVEELKESMDQLLKEYLLSRELDEAASCVRELNARHFHHELVKRGVKIAMEEDGRSSGAVTDGGGGTNENSEGPTVCTSLDAMAALFQFLVNNSIVSEYQVAKGVGRLRKLIPDLKLDVPEADGMLVEFEGLLPSSLLPK
ncbi:hypothetical protein ACHAWU_000033 [Discostella pseudostelligera]|uniref:MI domain-containing protein n=1 Tax=Discostella pseudostelligera TaxID=259834 RepID=A0ABD3M9S5_9STRA